MLINNMQNLVNKRLYRKLKCESLNEIKEKLMQSKYLNSTIINTTTSNDLNEIQMIQSDRILKDKRNNSPNMLDDLLENNFSRTNYIFNSFIFRKGSKSTSVKKSNSKEYFECNKSDLEIMLNSYREKINSFKDFIIIKDENIARFDNEIITENLNTNKNYSKSKLKPKFTKTEDIIENCIILDHKNKTNENYSSSFTYRNLNLEEAKLKKAFFPDLNKKLNKLSSMIDINNQNYNNNFIINNDNEVKCNNIEFTENKLDLNEKENCLHEKKKKLLINENDQIIEDDEDMDFFDYTDNEIQRAKKSSINNIKFLNELKLDFNKLNIKEKVIEDKNNNLNYNFLTNTNSENLSKFANDINFKKDQIQINLKPTVGESILNQNNNTNQKYLVENIKKLGSKNLNISKNLIFNNINNQENKIDKQGNLVNNQNFFEIKNELLFKNKFSPHNSDRINRTNCFQDKNNTYLNKTLANRNNLQMNKNIGNEKAVENENRNSKERHNTINLNLNLNLKFDLNLHNDFIKNEDPFVYRMKSNRDNFLKKNTNINMTRNKNNTNNNNFCNYFNNNYNVDNKSQKITIKGNIKNIFSNKTKHISMNVPSNDTIDLNLNRNNFFYNKLNKNELDFLNGENKTDRLIENRNFTKNSFFPKTNSKEKTINYLNSSSKNNAIVDSNNHIKKKIYGQKNIPNGKIILEYNYKKKAENISNSIKNNTKQVLSKSINDTNSTALKNLPQLGKKIGNKIVLQKENINFEKNYKNSIIVGNNYKVPYNYEKNIDIRSNEFKSEKEIFCEKNNQKQKQNNLNIKFFQATSNGYAFRYSMNLANKSKNAINNEKKNEISYISDINFTDRILIKKKKAD